MENVSSTHSTPPHAYAADALFRARTTASTDTNPAVVLTSVLTQTVHPTLVVTESTVITPDPVTVQTIMAQPGTTTVDTAQSGNHQTTHDSARSETMSQQTGQDTSTAMPASMTSSSIMEEQAASHTAEHSADILGHLNSNISVSDPVPDTSVPASSQSSLSSLVDSTNTSSTILSIVTSSSSMTAISANIVQLTSIHFTPTPISPSTSPTSSPTSSPVTNVTSSSTSTQDTSVQTGHDSTNVGAIVGGTVGGATFIALGVLACCFFIRRKGHPVFHRRQNSGQGLLGSQPSSPIRSLEISEPTLPTVQPPVIPSAPFFPTRRCSNLLGSHPVLEPATSNRDVPTKETNLTGDNNHSENPFADPVDNPFSPIVENSAPSNTVSVYSRASWESVQKLIEISSLPNPYASTNTPSKSSPAPPPSSSTASKHFKFTRDTKNRDSTRSDPFDLELPTNTLQKWPLP